MAGVSRFALIWLAVATAAYACSCLYETEAQKYARHDYVLTVAVTGTAILKDKVEYDVEVLGVLKKPDDSLDFIGSRTKIFTTKTSCQVYLEVGEYYVVGGPIMDYQKYVNGCDTFVRLGQSCVVPPCPKGCASWSDGCNTYQCRNGQVVSSTDNVCTEIKPARCESPELRCPDDCKIFNDGCNECECDNDSIATGCTERACLVQGAPFCQKYKPCVLCPAVIPQCPPECPNDCEYKPPSCTSCGRTYCPKATRTYNCDLFSVWTRREQMRCLRSRRSYTDLCCSVDHCCVKKGPTDYFYDVKRNRKFHYCQRTVCRDLDCFKP
mmetsp:Transcript_4639/g.14016  ORF Transcript_4639/g.14016 Transcript_4639/m.14016 type:complete len:324 (-) Transcript_4639:57-1028(-)